MLDATLNSSDSGGRAFTAGPYDLLYAAADNHILWGGQATHLLDMLPPQARNARALDLGCGDGVNAIELERRGYSVTGVDISALALSGLHNRARQANHALRGNYIQADVLDIKPQGDVAFDVIVSCGLFHCLPRSKRVAAHAAFFATCRPGAWVVFSTLSCGVDLIADHGTDAFDLPTSEEITRLFANLQVRSQRIGIISDMHRPLVGPHQHEITWVIAQLSS